MTQGSLKNLLWHRFSHFFSKIRIFVLEILLYCLHFLKFNHRFDRIAQTPECVYGYGFRTRTRFFEWARITYVFRTCISQIDRHQLCLRTSFLEITRTQLFIRTWFLRFTRTQFCLRTGVLKLNPYTIFLRTSFSQFDSFPELLKTLQSEITDKNVPNAGVDPACAGSCT